jgi:hypothetical protein
MHPLLVYPLVPRRAEPYEQRKHHRGTPRQLDLSHNRSGIQQALYEVSFGILMSS